MVAMDNGDTTYFGMYGQIFAILETCFCIVCPWLYHGGGLYVCVYCIYFCICSTTKEKLTLNTMAQIHRHYINSDHGTHKEKFSSTKQRFLSRPDHSWTPTMPNMKKTKKQSSSTLFSIGRVSSSRVTRIRMPKRRDKDKVKQLGSTQKYTKAHTDMGLSGFGAYYCLN